MRRKKRKGLLLMKRYKGERGKKGICQSNEERMRHLVFHVRDCDDGVFLPMIIIITRCRHPHR